MSNNTTNLSSSMQDAPPENVSELDAFMKSHKLHSYTKTLMAAGFEDLEDLQAVCRDRALLDSIITLPGHQAKFLRVVNEYSCRNSKHKIIQQNFSEQTNDSERGDTAASPSPTRERGKEDTEGLSDDERPPIEGISRIPYQRQRLAVRHRSTHRDHSQERSLSRQGSTSRLTDDAPPSTSSNSIRSVATNSRRFVVRKYVDFKVVVVGQGGVGKTALIHRLVSATFHSRIKCTIGVEFTSKTIQISRIVTVKTESGEDREFEVVTDINLQFWDIAGQEDCGNATRTYYHGAKAAIVVYDALNPSSLVTAIRWKKDLESKVKFGNTSLDIPAVLVANKVDMMPRLPILKGFVSSLGANGDHTKPNSQAKDSSNAYGHSQQNAEAILKPPETAEEVLNLVNTFRFSGHHFVSAKTGQNIDDMCDYLVACILKTDPHGTNVVPISFQKNPEQAEASRAVPVVKAAQTANGLAPLRVNRNDVNSPQKAKKKKTLKCVV